MKFTFALALATQATCIFSMPAPNETPEGLGLPVEASEQIETADTLEARGKCWYSAHNYKGPLCSDSGWCFMECTHGGRPGAWCWQAYTQSGSYIRCNQKYDCHNAAVNGGSKCHSTGCKCE